MIETLLSTVGVGFVPKLVEGFGQTYGFGMIQSLLVDNGMMFLLIILITTLFNIIRALRFCRGPKGEYKSTGITYGIKKGIVCGVVSTGAYLVLGLVPFLRIPFTLISLIPGLANATNGIILSIFYMLSYIMFAYPIWGAC